MSTTWRESDSFQRIFKGRRERTGPYRGVGLCQPLNPSSGQTVFRVIDCQEEKRTLPGAPADVSAFSYVAVKKPHPGAGILTGFPFAQRRTVRTFYGTTLGLRIDSPMSNCCSHGTFPHFSPQSSHLSICYYHQDLH
ncbi:hypothetical protein SLEP1_g59929 [Rubroshorea leprosula]|uniref:Uncharacterized protein n=1 Tax=Rubroshorea leprosula TaxID=152421 RepID=A0AAV5MWQ4_9ROSI|nr:hypothetical protein SLEP1_g59929 [Rubroshorea leprosula]